MVWERTILDGIAVCAVFNVAVALLWMLVPNALSKMLPPEIRKAAPKREKKEVAILAGVTGFRNLFWTGYVEMFFVDLGDFFGLDWGIDLMDGDERIL